MKRNHIAAIVAGAMIMAGAFFGKYTLDFLWGGMFATGIALGLSVTVGYWLQEKHQERMDKLRRDEIELHE